MKACPYTKTLLILVWIFALYSSVWAQQQIDSLPGLKWYKTFDGSELYDDYVNLEQDMDGALFCSGTYKGWLIIGTHGHPDYLLPAPNPPSWYQANAYVSKLDSSGQFLWAFQIERSDTSASTVYDIEPDGEGGVWVAGTFAYHDTIAGIWPADVCEGGGYLLHLDADGNPDRFNQFNAKPIKILSTLGQAPLLVLRPYSSAEYIIINCDTIGVNPDCPQNNVLLKLDRQDNVERLLMIHTDPSSYVTISLNEKSIEMDSKGNIYILLFISTNFAGDQGFLAIGSDTIPIDTSFAALVKLDPAWELDWYRTFESIEQNFHRVRIEPQSESMVFLAWEKYAAFHYSESYVSAFTHTGKQLWKQTATGYGVELGDIVPFDQQLYWLGSYEWDIQIGAAQFVLGERSWFNPPPRTGFIALLDAGTGKVHWVRSDHANQDRKNFIRAEVNPAGDLLVTTRVTTTSLHIDTLSLLLGPYDIPYYILTKLEGGPLPVDDTLPTQPDFAIWPNPSSGLVTVGLGEGWSGGSVLEVYNLLGQMVQRQELETPETTIDLGHMGGQVLVMRLKNNKSNKILTRKLVLAK